MIKRAFLGILAVLGLAFPLPAQQTETSFDDPYRFALYYPEVFSTIDSAALLHRLPVRSFLDGTRFAAAPQIGTMGMTTFDLASLPPVNEPEVQKITFSQTQRTDGKDFGRNSSGDAISTMSPIHYGGEVGFLYGHASGKYGGDLGQTYGVGTIATDKLQITVGTSYQEWNGKVPRRNR